MTPQLQWLVCICMCQAVEDRGIHAGKVNCDAHQRLCQEAQVQAYPSVRFYAGTSETRSTQVNTRHTAAATFLCPLHFMYKDEEVINHI